MLMLKIQFWTKLAIQKFLKLTVKQNFNPLLFEAKNVQCVLWQVSLRKALACEGFIN